MNELFKKDITIKICSVLIAMLFWLYVYNTSNPFTTATFSNVPLKIENEDFLSRNGYIVKNKYITNIDVTVRGRQNAVNKVRESNFDAVLDFSQIKSVSDKELNIIGPFCDLKDVVIESHTPQAIDIELVKSKNNTFQVQIVSNITLKPGYKILKITGNPDTIRIISEEVLIDSVDSIKAVIVLEELDRDITKKVDCKVYDKDGKVITTLSNNLNIDVKVEVAKEVPITPIIKGQPAADYIETMKVISPDKVLIIGAPDVLAKITELKTDPITIDNIRKNYSVTVPIKIPDNVKLVNTQNEVVVGISVEQLIMKDLTILKNYVKLVNINPDPALNYIIKTDNIIVRLKGRASVLDTLKIGDLSYMVDITGIGEGVHRLPLQITLPTQVEQVKDAFVEVKVEKITVPSS